jgi:thymidylate synthase
MNNPFDEQYKAALLHVLEHGEFQANRTGTPTLSCFGYQMRFDLSKGFPALTTKKLAWRSVVGELLWFLEGSTNERRLAEITYEKSKNELKDKKTIWTANADAQGKSLGYVNNNFVKELGPVYGYQWRTYNGYAVDQIKNAIRTIINDADNRRIIVNAWNPLQIDRMALPPCHILFQFKVMNGKLHCHMYQRSMDLPLGAPFNIASYALLTHMIAKLTNLSVGELIISVGDIHIYENQINPIKEQLEKDPYDPPTLSMPHFESLEELIKTKPSQYYLVGYQHHPTIKMDMAV